MQTGAGRKLTAASAHRLLRAGVGLVFWAALAAPCLLAQNPAYGGQPFPQMQAPAPMGLPPGPDTGNVEMQAKRLEALNADRQKSMVADTDRLVKLAAELNAQINGAHPRRLSDAQFRMVAEIEKLAHNIREKMCTSVNGNPQLMGPSPIIAPATIP